MADIEQPPLIRWVRPGHWLMLDYLVACAYALLMLPILVNNVGPAAGAALVLGGWATFALPIAVRRRWPLPALALVLAGSIGSSLADPKLYLLAIAPMALVLYLAATGPRRAALLVLGAALTSAACAGLPDFAHAGATVVSGFGYVTVWTVGYAVGEHHRYTRTVLRHQAKLAEAELSRARRAVTAERLRIARELHDVIAHSISVITVQAGFGALVVEKEPLKARAALDAIELTGRQSLIELRALLGVLRAAEPDDGAESAALDPSPSLADLDPLLARTRQAGVTVQLTVSGDPRPLAAGVELATFRIIQEALTNVVRHSGSPTARVEINHGDHELMISVADDGPGSSSPAEAVAGHGLIGMRERVSAYGGTLDAAPSARGGFMVRVALPLPAAIASGPPAAA